MQRLLKLACHAANRARAKGKPIPPGRIATIEHLYDMIINTTITYHNAQPALIKGANKQGPAPDMPFTNNLAEHDARMMKLRQKISGSLRSIQSAEDFAILRSLISTAKKQSWDIIQTFNKSPDILLETLQTA